MHSYYLVFGARVLAVTNVSKTTVAIIPTPQVVYEYVVLKLAKTLIKKSIFANLLGLSEIAKENVFRNSKLNLSKNHK